MLLNLPLLFQDGITVAVNGDQGKVRGAVVALLADTLAAHDLGGFKVGVGFALRKCRLCLATNDDIQTEVNLLAVHHHRNHLSCPY